MDGGLRIRVLTFVAAQARLGPLQFTCYTWARMLITSKRSIRLMQSLGIGVVAAVASALAIQPVAAQNSAKAPTSGVELLQRMHDRYAKSWYRTLSFTQTTDIRLPTDSVIQQTWWETASIPGYLLIRRLTNVDKNAAIYRKDSVYSRRNGAP